MTTELYNKKIVIVVQSKFPKVLEEFKTQFEATTEDFKNLKLLGIIGEEYGAKEINRILRPITAQKEVEIFGVYNDDLWFGERWLEDILEKLEIYPCVSPGYVETDKWEVFKKAVDGTKDEIGVVPFLYGPAHTFRTSLFRQIGLFDERFDWSVDDLDWAWRIKLNGMESATSKKITIGHRVGTTLTKTKGWNRISDINKELFYDKHGWPAYRHLRNHYKNYHSYFVEWK